MCFSLLIVIYGLLSMICDMTSFVHLIVVIYGDLLSIMIMIKLWFIIEVINIMYSGYCDHADPYCDDTDLTESSNVRSNMYFKNTDQIWNSI